MKTFEQARSFVYRNARPLELAVFHYHFENGSREDILNALSYYQNSDGGFGNGLEADSLNPNSSPLQTSTACDILHGIGFTNSQHPIVQGILRYFSSGDSFDGSRWLACIESNNRFPHAEWWNTENAHWHSPYNPTADIAGFIIRHTEHESELYALGVKTAKWAVEGLLNADSIDMGVGSCYVRLGEYLEESKATALIPYDLFKAKLHKSVCALINTDVSTWSDYTCKPSQFIRSRDSEFYEANKELAEYECDYIIENQCADGSWDIPWKWVEYPEEWAVSKNWWKSNVIIQNLLYLKAFGRI